MFKSVKLEFSDSSEIVVPTNGITVFVGPNNSGKSLVLREIESCFRAYPMPSNLKIVSDYEVEWHSIEYINQSLDVMRIEPSYTISQDQILVAWINANGFREENQVNIKTLHKIAESKQNKHLYANNFLKYGVIRLDGRSRFNLTSDQTRGDLLQPAQNIIGKLFRDDKIRKIARDYVSDAFGLNLVIDPTGDSTLRYRLTSNPVILDEQSLNQEAREFHKNATHIQDASDGVQAYIGILTGVVSSEYHTILVDEPEAFLHPPLARKLGRHLAQISRSRNGALMAATHSADFLMGVIQGGADVRVVKLEYQNGRSKGKLIESDMLKKLFNSPLMRSTNAASALFYDGVVVTESDNDRVFYSEIYYRILESNPKLPSVLFINAQNVQTLKDIVGPLRQLGVPAAAIADIDVIKDGAVDWPQWLSALQIPGKLHEGYRANRASVLRSFEESGLDMKSDGGVELLGKDEKLAALDFFESIEAYGMFVVKCGELENWLKSMNVKSGKKRWVIDMLNALGDDPASNNYVRPTKGDVWDFIVNIVSWIGNASRKGTD